MAGLDYTKPQTLAKDTASQLQTIIEGLPTVPVKVDINIVPVQDQGDGPISSIEKTSKKKAAKKKQVKKPLDRYRARGGPRGLSRATVVAIGRWTRCPSADRRSAA